jgi:serine/threonine protein phosphatase 1
MPPRLIAIGDIHGCLAALRAILAKISPRPDDTIVALGDYVDRGPESRGVLDALLELGAACRLVPLLGNHDEMFLDILRGREEYLVDWLSFGGDATLASYGNLRPESIPAAHRRFLENCVLLHETNAHFCAHGSYDPIVPLEMQSPRLLLWGKIRPLPPRPHYSGKIAVVGHTAQREGEILDVGHLKCLDTCCYGGGYLTAMELITGEVWQADKKGRLRTKMGMKGLGIGE